MGLDKIFLILVCVSGAFTFTCPDDSHSFYHADVSTGCTVYHFCENSQLATMTCPAGEAFNHDTSQCEDAASVNCVETMDHHHIHHHHKRAIEEYHTIPIQQLKTKVVDFYRELKPMVISAVQDLAPSVYAKFESDYLPSIKSVKDDVMPFFYDKVWPQVQKSVSYVRNIAGRVIKKGYESYELSNSTHITIVSMSDIANDVSNDLQPVIRLGRYMSANMMQHTRTKRSPMGSQIPELLSSFVQPVVRNIFSSIGATFTGQENTLTSKVILPILYRMMEDPETRFDLIKVFYSTKAAFTPVIWEMLSRQTFNTPEGTVIRIPRSTFDAAVNRFYTDTKPIIHKIMNKHLSMMLYQASQNVPVIMQSIAILKDAKQHHTGVLKDAVLNFITKHGALLQTSDSRYVNTYTLTEIKKDLKPIYITLLQVAVEYFSKNKNSWVNMFFSGNNILYKSLIGSPVYAKPSSQAASRIIPSSRIVSRKIVYRG